MQQQKNKMETTKSNSAQVNQQMQNFGKTQNENETIRCNFNNRKTLCDF